MTFARDDKDILTRIENGAIVRYRIVNGNIIPLADKASSPTAHTAQSQVVDLEGKPHTHQEVAKAMTAHEREKAALRAMESARPARPIASKNRPVAASSSATYEADQKTDLHTLEEEQLTAYGEDPIFTPIDDKKEPLAEDDFKGIKFNGHNPAAPNELMTTGASFPDLPARLVLSHLGGDLTGKIVMRPTLFGNNIEIALIPKAKEALELFLGGEENEVEEAFAMVEKCPAMLRCVVSARDRSGSPDFRVMTPDKTKAELAKGAKNVYVNRAADGGLDYQLLDHNSKHISGHITPQQLGQEIKETPPLTLPELNKLRGRILKITAERGHTPFGRLVKNTIVGALAMAGEVDLQEGMEEKEALQKQRGLVERLAVIPGGLSREEVANQIEQAVTGKEAQEQTQKRVDRVMTATKQFAEGILMKASEFQGDKKDYNNFPAFQALCQPHIDQLEKALQHNPNELITAGAIFDELVLHKAADWFEYGYELCLLPKGPDNEVKLAPGKLYLEEKEGCVAYSVLKPDGILVRHVKVAEVKAPNPFELNGFNNLRFGHQDEYQNRVLKDKIFTAATQANHIETPLQRFGGWWTIMSDVFWVNGYGKLQTKLSRRSQDVVCLGIGNVVDDKQIPLDRGHRDISCVNSSSGCGVSFYLGYYGPGRANRVVRGANRDVAWGVENLCRSKTAALQNLRGNPRSQLRVGAP